MRSTLLYVLSLLVLSLTNLEAQTDNQQETILKFIDAQNHFNENEFEEALTDLESARKKLGHTNPRILQLSIRCYYNLGRFKEAKRKLDFYSNHFLLESSDEIKNDVLSYYSKVEIAAEKQLLRDKRIRESVPDFEAQVCANCDGSGRETKYEYKNCTYVHFANGMSYPCEGKGYYHWGDFTVECPNCKGTGEIELKRGTKECIKCRGKKFTVKYAGSHLTNEEIEEAKYLYRSEIEKEIHNRIKEKTDRILYDLELIKCDNCNSNGRIRIQPKGYGQISYEETCPECNGEPLKLVYTGNENISKHELNSITYKNQKVIKTILFEKKVNSLTANYHKSEFNRVNNKYLCMDIDLCPTTSTDTYQFKVNSDGKIRRYKYGGPTKFYGYINESGEIELDFKSIESLNPDQRFRREFKYTRYYPFFYGLAKVVNHNNTMYIDKTGKVAIPHNDEWYSTNHFTSDGLALIQFDKNSAAYIDKSGNEVLRVNGYDKYGGFYNGLAMVGVMKNSKGDKQDYIYGYIDLTGELVIPLIYEKAECFVDGKARVWKRNKGKPKYINKEGEFIKIN